MNAHATRPFAILNILQGPKHQRIAARGPNAQVLQLGRNGDQIPA
jgi:hypothetical protein